MLQFHKPTYNKNWVNNNAQLEHIEDISSFCKTEFNHPNFFLTKSCTQSLELAFIAADLPLGSEVILPSYGFVSLANAIYARGLKCVFVDCERGTMNIDLGSIRNAISADTRAIATINYAGIACDYDQLLPLCKEAGLLLIEDNAHGIGATFKSKWLGSFGDISTTSFDYLKNITCHQGGGVVVNNSGLVKPFTLAADFGTNRKDVIRGDADFYQWQTLGSNAIFPLPLADPLYRQLLHFQEINTCFVKKWEYYLEAFSHLVAKQMIEIPEIPDYATHNGHLFWIKTKDQEERQRLIQYLLRYEIQTAIHYYPLHQSAFGKKAGVFRGDDRYTTKDSMRLLRLPLYYDLTKEEQERVVWAIEQFYKS